MNLHTKLCTSPTFLPFRKQWHASFARSKSLVGMVALEAKSMGILFPACPIYYHSLEPFYSLVKSQNLGTRLYVYLYGLWWSTTLAAFEFLRLCNNLNGFVQIAKTTVVLPLQKPLGNLASLFSALTLGTTFDPLTHHLKWIDTAILLRAHI